MNAAWDQSVRRRVTRRRWVFTHPHVVAWRAWLWWKHKRVAPWNLSLAQIIVIDPRPVPPETLARLRAAVRGEQP